MIVSEEQRTQSIKCHLFDESWDETKIIRQNETSLHLVRCKIFSDCKQELALTRRFETRRSVRFAELESLREVSMGELRMAAR